MPTSDADKDLPLREDTRLLGRLLGDVLRAQTGESSYARIEAIQLIHAASASRQVAALQAG